MSNCNIDYAPASFNGILFEAMPISESFGFRKLVHRYPGTDYHHVENLGGKEERFTVEGKFHGANFRDQQRAAKLVWRRKSAGLLFEPAQNKGFLVELLDIEWKFNEKSLNSIGFTAQFVEIGSGPYPRSQASSLGLLFDVINTFTGIIRTRYKAVNAEPKLTELSSGNVAAQAFVRDSARMTISTGWNDLIAALEATKPVLDLDANVDAVLNVFDTAAEGPSILAFASSASDLRLLGTTAEQSQADLYALLALVFEFEQVAASTQFGQLKDFVNRANALKGSSLGVQADHAIDDLIAAAGRSAQFKETVTLDKQQNALVASYELFGEVGRANEIIACSRGVSGARLSQVSYQP